MKTDSPFAKLIAQATALTRRGSLGEATQAIQRALHLQRGAATPPAPATPAEAARAATDAIVLDGLVREIDTPTSPPKTQETPWHTPPDTAPRPASFEEFPFATALGLRHYKLFTPAGLSDEPAPLVVMLHGCKQDPDDFAAGTRMNELAQAQGFRVLYPAQAPRSNMQRCWNWFQPGDQKRGSGEPALLAAITRHVMQARAVDAQRVYVAGLSAGGAMAVILAHEYPDLFAAAGIHSGLPQGAAHDVATAFAAMQHGPRSEPTRPNGRRVPFIVFHGDQDGTVHPINGEHLVAGHDTSEVSHGMPENGRSFVRTTYRDDADVVVAEHWLVHGSGHAWSGGNAQGSYTDEQGPDASREMLRFFNQQRLKD
ncbi:MAG: PHB depolymerase family esterase [Cytophagales bacterium]|nr:PHB depolymerase family esterase [Rhizobacter sp.]